MAHLTPLKWDLTIVPIIKVDLCIKCNLLASVTCLRHYQNLLNPKIHYEWARNLKFWNMKPPYFEGQRSIFWHFQASMTLKCGLNSLFSAIFGQNGPFDPFKVEIDHCANYKSWSMHQMQSFDIGHKSAPLSKFTFLQNTLWTSKKFEILKYETPPILKVKDQYFDIFRPLRPLNVA